MLLHFPAPKERPLSRQAEIACGATLGTGIALLVGAQATEGELSRQMLIGAMACIATMGPPVTYQLMQVIRWTRRSG